MATIKIDVPTDTAHLAIILERWYDDAIRNQKVFGGQYGGELMPYRSHESGFDYTHSGHQIGLGIHGQPPNNRTALFRDLIHVDAYEITGQLTRLTLRGKPGYDDAVNDLAQFIEQHFTSQPIGSKLQRVAGEVSGGVTVDAHNVAVGNDVVGRDKIIQVALISNMPRLSSLHQVKSLRQLLKKTHLHHLLAKHQWKVLSRRFISVALGAWSLCASRRANS